MKLVALIGVVALIGCGGNGNLGGGFLPPPIKTRELLFRELEGVRLWGISNDGRVIVGAAHAADVRPILMKDFAESAVDDPVPTIIRYLSPSARFAVAIGPSFSYFLWEVGAASWYPIPITTYADDIRVSDEGYVEGRWLMPPDGISTTLHFRLPDQFDHSPWPPPDPFETPIPHGFSKKLVVGFSASKTAAFGHVERSDGSWEACIWLPNLGPRVIPDAPENDLIDCHWVSDDGTRALVYVLLGDQTLTYLWTEDRGYLSMPALAGIAGAQPRDPRYWGLIARSANGRYFVLTHSLNLDEHYWIHVP